MRPTPSRLTVDSPYELFRGTLRIDCANSGMASAWWDIRHSYYGPSNSLDFDAGQTSATWDFYDWEHLGTYYVEPSMAYDDDYNDLSQNTQTTSVRLGSRLSLSSSRSGNYVTLRSTATRYAITPEAFRPWGGKSVALSYRTCSTCSWHHLASRTTNKYGKISYRFYAPKTSYYQARTAHASTVWGRTSAASRR